MKALFKTIGHLCCLLLVSPCALSSAVERRISRKSTGIFRFWGDVMSLMPGLPGAYLRRAYYCCTLDSCSAHCHIGFGTIFAHREATVEDSVYLGTYALLGSVILRSGSLIGSRASLISGSAQHRRGPDGEWLPADIKDRECIEIGTGAWLGEACIVAANVGPGALVAAGSVVAGKVPRDVMVAGNPARFVKRLDDSASPDAVSQEDGSSPRSKSSASRQEELIHE